MADQIWDSVHLARMSDVRDAQPNLGRKAHNAIEVEVDCLQIEGAYMHARSETGTHPQVIYRQHPPPQHLDKVPIAGSVRNQRRRPPGRPCSPSGGPLATFSQDFGCFGLCIDRRRSLCNCQLMRFTRH